MLQISRHQAVKITLARRETATDLCWYAIYGWHTSIPIDQLPSHGDGRARRKLPSPWCIRALILRWLFQCPLLTAALSILQHNGITTADYVRIAQDRHWWKEPAKSLTASDLQAWRWTGRHGVTRPIRRGILIPLPSPFLSLPPSPSLSISSLPIPSPPLPSVPFRSRPA